MNILVVEDDAVSRALLEKTLSTWGHHVTAFADGLEALEHYRRNPTPVVITDWEMPGMDGLELTRRMRRAHTRIYSYIVLLTAAEYEGNFEMAIDQGVDDFIQKPMDLRLLKARLKVGERHAMMASLTSALPICIQCKAVRNNDESWMRIEEYFGKESGIDFSHGYCPDCYYDHSLAPEVDRWRSEFNPPAPQRNELVDHGHLTRLLHYDQAHSPDLVVELIDGFHDTTPKIERDLERYTGRRPNTRIQKRLNHFARRCEDLGATRLGSLVTLVARGDALPDDRDRALVALQTTLDLLKGTLAS